MQAKKIRQDGAAEITSTSHTRTARYKCRLTGDLYSPVMGYTGHSFGQM